MEKHFESLYPPTSRYQEIEKLLAFIKEGNSCQTVSLPGGGRTNLLSLLSYNKNVRLRHLGEDQKLFLFVYLNFSEIRNKPLIDGIKFLFLSLIDSLEQGFSSLVIPDLIGNPDSRFRGNDKKGLEITSSEIKTLKAIFNESVLANDELILFHGLKRAIEYLALEKGLIVVFLFDNFEEYVAMITPVFFTNLRILRNLAKYHFSVVFSLNRPLEDLIDSTTFADFYEFIAGHIIYLPLFDKPTLEFRINYIQKASGKKIDKVILDNIIDVTGGHGKLTRLCVEAILVNSNKQLAISLTLEKFLLGQKPITGALLQIWNSLTPGEQNILASSHQHLRHSGNQAKPEYPESENRKRDSGQARITESYLQNIGLLKNGKITIKLLAEFIKQKPKVQISNKHISLDLLSDKLTSFEYNLLKFLLENPNRVIDREEIINAVWKNEKSTAGVTDQALDQLIFRLRHKIETNPNQPKHLLTVKGRGLKFEI